MIKGNNGGFLTYASAANPGTVVVASVVDTLSYPHADPNDLYLTIEQAVACADLLAYAIMRARENLARAGSGQ